MGYLDIKGLKSGYNKKIILNDISFSVKKGEFLGIIGPNGAGKTTLLKTLTQIIRPYCGSVLVEGRDIHNMASHEAARVVAMVSQSLSSIFSFSVMDIVLMGRTPYLGIMSQEKKDDIDIANEALRQADLAGSKDSFIDELSAGERQRVLIAKALAQRPAVLLLDEPTAHLDIGHQIDILDMIVSLQARYNLTVIAVFHDLNMAWQYSSRIMLLDKGEIKALGDPRDVLTQQIIGDVFAASVRIEQTSSKLPLIISVSRKNKPQENR